MMAKKPCVYMMSDRYHGAIYTGVTAVLEARSFQHRSGRGSAFCSKYGIGRLIYAEFTERRVDAIAREKAIKKWRREWKIELIERTNPDWLHLFDTLNGAAEEAAPPLPQG